jgi:hypothetical protein
MIALSRRQLKAEMQQPKRSAMRLVKSGAERFCPPVIAGSHLIGVVQRGLQIGALIEMPDGSYAQANGDVLQKLNTSRVREAMRSAGWGRPATALAAPRESSPPTVIVKRRRVIPDAARL